MSGETHWTGLKFHGHLKKEYQEELGYSTLLRYLSENDIELRSLLVDEIVSTTFSCAETKQGEPLSEAYELFLPDRYSLIVWSRSSRDSSSPKEMSRDISFGNRSRVDDS